MRPVFFLPILVLPSVAVTPAAVPPPPGGNLHEIRIAGSIVEPEASVWQTTAGGTGFLVTEEDRGYALPARATGQVRVWTAAGDELRIDPLGAGQVPGPGGASSTPILPPVSVTGQVQDPGNRVRFPLSYPGMDEEYRIAPSGLKHDVILREPPVLPLAGNGSGSLVVAWHLGLSPGLRPVIGETSRSPEGPTETRGTISFRNTRGEIPLAIAPPGIVSAPLPGTHFGAGTLGTWRIEPDGEGWRLELHAPLAWLLDPGRLYPVRLDPTVLVYPRFTSDTGFVSFDSLASYDRRDGVIDSGTLYVNDPLWAEVEGFARFSTAAIPDTATIQDVSLEVWISNHDNWNDPAVPLPMEVRECPIDPATATPSQLFQAIRSANPYVTTSIPRTGSAWCAFSYRFFTLDLGPGAVADLQALLPVDRFSIGFTSEIVTDPEFDHLDYMGHPEEIYGECGYERLPGTRIALRVAYSENLPPVCDAGADLLEQCDGVPMQATASDPEGGPLAYSWSSFCPGTRFDPRSDVLNPTVWFGTSCGVDCVLLLRVTDADENVCTDTVRVRVEDTIPPIVSRGLIRNCYPNEQAAESAAIFATGASDNCPGITTRSASTTGTCDASIVVTGTDACGNSASVDYRTRIDGTPPRLTPGTIAPCYATRAEAEAAAIAATTVADECPGPVLVGASTRGLCDAAITVTATDSCGNSASILYATRIDADPPELYGAPLAACYASRAEAEAAALAATVATDYCPGPVAKTVATAGSCDATVTVTATDSCGNAATWTYTTRIDDAPPQLTAGTIASCYPTRADAEAAALAATVATDGCPGPVALAASTSGACDAVVTVTATDSCGNSASVAYTTRIDDTPPQLAAGTIASCYPTRADAEAAALAATVATDGCPGPVTRTAFTPGGCDATVTVTATDSCGNSASIAYTTRIDDAPPQLAAGTIASCYPTRAEAEIAALAATVATDGCPGPVALAASTSRDCDAVVTVTATDSCGNAGSVTYRTRIDATPPVLTPGSIGTCSPTASCAENTAIFVTTAIDNCPGPVVKSASTVGDCDARVTVTGEDTCGNRSAIEYETRIDDTPPVVTAGGIGLCYPTIAAAESAAIAATTATDNCPGSLYKSAFTAGTCDVTITVTVTDSCTNSASVEYRTRIDSTPPVLTRGGIGYCYPSPQAAEAAAIAATTVVDDCPGPVAKTASTSGTCDASVTVTATDSCGNAASVTYRTRIDGAPPVVAAGPIASCYPTQAAAEAAALTATTTTDNCPGPVTKTASTSGTCDATVTVTATDSCGNAASVTYRTRIDGAPPVITAGTIASCYATRAEAEQAALAATTATDNCPGPLARTASTTGDCDATITVTVTDSCGNTASVAYRTRIDATPPVLVSLGPHDGACLWSPNHKWLCLPGLASEVVAADNCPGPLPVTLAGCRSSQPENGLGDGNTAPDCRLDGGGGACFRAERQGVDRAPRAYGVGVLVTDSCGNATSGTIRIFVPHDRREHPECLRADERE